MKKISILVMLVSVSILSNAQNWALIPSGTSAFLSGCSYGSATHIYITGDGPTLLKSTNSGTSFSPLSTSFIPFGYLPSSCFFTSQDTGFVVGGDQNGLDGFIYKTTNGGSSWTSVLSSAPSGFNAITFPGPMVGYAVGGQLSAGIIYKTIDGGASWTSIYNSAPINRYLANANFLNINTGLVVGLTETAASYEASVAYINGGVFNSIAIDPSYILFTDVYCLSIDSVIVSAFDFSGSYILLSTNGGVSWTPVYTNTVDINALTFVNQHKGYAVGTLGLILKTINGGASWTTMSSPSSDDLFAVDFRDSTNGIIVGDLGTILKAVVCTGSPSSSSLTIPPSCNPVTVNGQTYFGTGIYTQLLTNSTGCDSTLTINVMISNPSSTNLTASTCTTYTLNGTTYTLAGTYNQMFVNAAGCDSNVTLFLTVNAVSANVTQAGATLTASPSGASYQWLNCPLFSIIPGATNQSYTATANGSYAVRVSQGACSDTSLCKTVSGVGIEEYSSSNDFQLFPNPGNGNIVLSAKHNLDHVTVRVMDLTGRTVWQQANISGKKVDIDISAQANGIYFLEIDLINSPKPARRIRFAKE